MIETRDILAFLEKQQIEFVFDGDIDGGIETYCSLKELLTLKDMGTACISFARNPSEDIVTSLFQFKRLLLVTKDQPNYIYGCNVIKTKNPHRTFFLIIESFFGDGEINNCPEKSCIKTNIIGNSFCIGAFSYIGANASIGDNVTIGNNVSIEKDVIIGNNVWIESGVRIGTWGFGRYLNPDKTSTMAPHLGGIRIGNNTFIGANTIIARGTLSDTIICDDVLIDAGCYIAHNVIVNKRTIITGFVLVAGSAVVGEDVWLSPGSIINSNVTVGDRAFVGMGSMVTKNIHEDMYAFGTPAKEICRNNDKKYKI